MVTETVDLVDRAVATTAGAGFRFDPAGHFTHLFDPATGRSPAIYRTVSVVAPTATEADALSTAFSLIPASRIGDIAAARPGVQARLVTVSGDLLVYGTGNRTSRRLEPLVVGQNGESARNADAEKENRMRGFVFVALVAVAISGEARAQARRFSASARPVTRSARMQRTALGRF